MVYHFLYDTNSWMVIRLMIMPFFYERVDTYFHVGAEILGRLFMTNIPFKSVTSNIVICLVGVQPMALLEFGE